MREAYTRYSVKIINVIGADIEYSEAGQLERERAREKQRLGNEAVMNVVSSEPRQQIRCAR
jgi:hypothetical protein